MHEGAGEGGPAAWGGSPSRNASSSCSLRGDGDGQRGGEGGADGGADAGCGPRPRSASGAADAASNRQADAASASAGDASGGGALEAPAPDVRARCGGGCVAALARRLRAPDSWQELVATPASVSPPAESRTRPIQRPNALLSMPMSLHADASVGRATLCARRSSTARTTTTEVPRWSPPSIAMRPTIAGWMVRTYTSVSSALLAGIASSAVCVMSSAMASASASGVAFEGPSNAQHVGLRPSACASRVRRGCEAAVSVTGVRQRSCRERARAACAGRGGRTTRGRRRWRGSGRGRGRRRRRKRRRERGGWWTGAPA